MDYEEATALVAEYNALPDFDARLNWNGYARLPHTTFRCVCGHKRSILIDMGELIRMVERGPEKFILDYYDAQCWGHGGEEEESEREEED